jgi:tRNA-2-methylthio-N6-dimethylallyladenosine synthase
MPASWSGRREADVSGKRFYIETFGCQMNVNDSEKVAGLLAARGYRPATDPASADFVFVNTCAVREKASEKLYTALGSLRRLKARRPQLSIGVGGCVAQLHGEQVLSRAPHVDLLVGTHNFVRVPQLLERVEQTGERAVDLDRKADGFAVPAQAVAHGNPVRAYVTIMEGCNHVCSFCVVPRTRGTEVNRPADAVVAEVREVVERGFREVMLLGQTVNAYRDATADFVDLLERVHDVAGLARLRFTTSHPAHVDERLARAFRDLPRLCPNLHLPAQSGSDRILASMRRGYTREGYLETLALLRDHVPELALSGDLIVGYPGESQEDFEATLELLDRAGYESLFSFAYSPRPGTAALRLADDVPDAEKRRRLGVLNQRQQRLQALRNAARVGTEVEVLVEDVAPDGHASGRSPDFKVVHFDGGARVGETVRARVERAGPNSLVGRRISPTNSLTGSSAVPIL